MGNSHHSGRIMASDETDLYAFGRTQYGWGSAFTYELYKAPLSQNAPEADVSDKQRRRGAGRAARVKKSPRAWAVDIPVLARSIIKAGDKLLVTGPKKLYDENEAILQVRVPALREQIAAQAGLWDKKADLLVIDSNDGKVLEKANFDFAPVWDGVAVAERSLFVSGTDGNLYRLQ